MNRNSLRNATAGKFIEILIDVLFVAFLVNLIYVMFQCGLETLNSLLYDCAAFCCSFQAKASLDTTGSGDGALAKTFSQ